MNGSAIGSSLAAYAVRSEGWMEHAGGAGLDRCAWLAAKSTGAPIAVICMAEQAREHAHGSWGLPETWDSSQHRLLARKLAAHVVAAGMPFVVGAGVDAWTRDDDALPELGAAAFASVPLRTADGHVRGALSVIDTSPRAWSDDDLRALEALAALLMQQVDADGERAARTPAAETPALFGADAITPLRADDHPFTRALRGETVTQAEIFVRLPDQAEGRWHRINATPLRDPEGMVRGAIVVGSDVTEQRLAQERLAQTVETLRMLALLDELTGLHNRRGFTALAEHQIKIADQTGRPLLIFFADLDDLKGINDTFGHEAGDQALRDAARLLRATFRDSDLLARLGGDEFVVLACDATLADADLFASRLHAALRAHNTLADRRFLLSISTGATAYDPRSPEPLDTLLQRADAAMYRDKRLRRASDRAALGR